MERETSTWGNMILLLLLDSWSQDQFYRTNHHNSQVLGLDFEVFFTLANDDENQSSGVG